MSESNMLQYLDEQFDTMLGDIAYLVSIPSVSTDAVQVARGLEAVLELGRRLGFHVETKCNEMVGVIEVGEGCETVGILTHVDVVPPGDEALWRTGPFEPVVADGALWGRGTFDDKGPLVSCLYAMKAVAQSGQPLQKKLQMIVGTQEEVPWVDMKAYVATQKLPDYGFTPDGEFPLCNIEKGAARLTITVPMADETGPAALLTLEGGTMINAIPASCTALLRMPEDQLHAALAAFPERDKLMLEPERGLFRITAQGRGTHSCQPERGENAIILLCRFLSGLPLPETGFARAAIILAERMEPIYGEKLGLYSESEYLEGEFIHRNAMSCTLARTERDCLKISVDVRTTATTSEAQIVAAFTQLAQEMGGTMELLEYKGPVFVSKDRPFMKAFAEAYDKYSGYKNEFALAYGGSYAKAVPNVASWGPLFPGEEDTCHEANERIVLENLRKMTRVYAEALRQIALSKESFL